MAARYVRFALFLTRHGKMFFPDGPLWPADERFGARSRPYLLHIAKVIPVPIMKEAQAVFIKELTAVGVAALCLATAR